MKKLNELFSFLMPKQQPRIKLSHKQRMYIRQKRNKKNLDYVKGSK